MSQELKYSGECGACGVEVEIGLEPKPGVTMKEALAEAPRCYNDPCPMCGEEMEYGLRLPQPRRKAPAKKRRRAGT